MATPEGLGNSIKKLAIANWEEKNAKAVVTCCAKTLDVIGYDISGLPTS
jgi:hypothetical protein